MSARFFDVSGHVYAHRGLWGGAIPENSLAAFQAAADAGTGVELDVRLTADGVPVVFHDGSLERMCNVREWLHTCSLTSLARVALPDGSRIPTLAEVLDVMGGRPVLIELKVDGAAGDIAERTAAIIDGAGGQLAVMSFDETTVARLCRLISDRPIGLLAVADNHVEFDIAAKAATARALGCDYIAPHHSLLGEMAALAGGLPLVTWTIRTPEELQLARQHGAAPIFEGMLVALVKPPRAPI